MHTLVVSKDWFTEMDRFIAEGAQLPGTVVLDPTYTTVLSLRLSVVPHSVIVGTDNKAISVWVGSVDDNLEREIANALEALTF
jgi:hypothetical protein